MKKIIASILLVGILLTGIMGTLSGCVNSGNGVAADSDCGGKNS